MNDDLELDALDIQILCVDTNETLLIAYTNELDTTEYNENEND